MRLLHCHFHLFFTTDNNLPQLLESFVCLHTIAKNKLYCNAAASSDIYCIYIATKEISNYDLLKKIHHLIF